MRRIRGSTLIEALIALAILAQVIVIALAIISSTSRSASVTRNKMQCLGYAQDGIEKIRNIRDTNLSKPTFPYLENIQIGQVTINPDQSPSINLNNFVTSVDSTPQVLNDPKFKRIVTISNPVVGNENIIQVDSAVTYSGNKSCSISAQLTNWRQ